MINKAFFIALVLFIISSPLVLGEDSSADFVTFNADIPLMLVENTSFNIAVNSIPYKDGKPVSVSPLVVYEIWNIGDMGNSTFSGETTIPAGRLSDIRVPGLTRGYYEIRIYASTGDVDSLTTKHRFGVFASPDPYLITFSRDGGSLHFSSRIINETGAINPDITFNLEIWRLDIGIPSQIVMAFPNVTSIDYDIPDDVRSGILYVDVIDSNLWRNGGDVDIMRGRFSGDPISYDYNSRDREPEKSSSVARGVASGVIILFLIPVLYSVERRSNG